MTMYLCWGLPRKQPNTALHRTPPVGAALLGRLAVQAVPPVSATVRLLGEGCYRKRSHEKSQDSLHFGVVLFTSVGHFNLGSSHDALSLQSLA